MSDENISEPINESPLNDELLKPEVVLQSEGTVSRAKFSPKRTFILSSIILVIAIGSFALYKSKPTEDKFELWVKKEAAEKRKKSGNLIQKGVSIATQIQILATYRYSDRLLFVTVQAEVNGEKLHFIGIANSWFLLP